MKEYKLKITENEDGLHVGSTNDGFNAMELVGMLEMKKQDLIAQAKGEINPDIERKYVEGSALDMEPMIFLHNVSHLLEKQYYTRLKKAISESDSETVREFNKDVHKIRNVGKQSIREWNKSLKHAMEVKG